jgi:hemoglobin-like flavoprotein
MNEQQITLVQETFERVKPQAPVVAATFYNTLFSMDPNLRPLFKAPLREQGDKLMSMLAVAVSGLRRLDTIVPAVEALGRRHAGYGVDNSHYATVGAALLQTLRNGLGDDFTPEVEAAWTEAYTLLAGAMQAGAMEPSVN